MKIEKFYRVTPEFLLFAKTKIIDEGWSFNVLIPYVKGGDARLRKMRSQCDVFNDLVEYSKMRTKLGKQNSFYSNRLIDYLAENSDEKNE